MDALKIILGGAFFVGIMLFLVGMFVAPKHLNVKRTTTINAPAETVFPYVSSLEAIDKWSPWAKMDPNMKNTFEGAPGAVGSSNSWDSEKSEVGAGSQTITSIEPNKLVVTRLDMKRPYEATNTGTVRLNSNAKNTETEVAWSIRGDYTFMEGLFALFSDPEKKIGPKFQEGLTMLKTQVEQDNTIMSSKDKMPATAN